MTSERRYSARHRLDLPVYIRYHKRPFLGAKARDVSIGGMFLSVQALTLPIGTPIELELRCFGRRWLLPAFVSYGDNSGIGVMFQEPQSALFQAITEQASLPLPPLNADPRVKPLSA